MKKRKKYEQIAYDEAKQSMCMVRQVGAVLVHNRSDSVIGQGHNYSEKCFCNDPLFGLTNKECASDVVHAEVACLDNAAGPLANCLKGDIFTLYVTQPPCNNCLDAINNIEVTYDYRIDVEVCEQFLKFDDTKIRYELIPPEWETALAEVLTYGAKKYKPNNWRKGEKERYHGAVMRHWNAYRSGEVNDPETGMPHLWHMFTNVGFLITLEGDKNEN